MKTIGEVLPLGAKYLKERGVQEFQKIAEELLSAIVGGSRIDLYLRFDFPLQEEELSRYREYLKRGGRKEPWQQIVGSLSFYDCIIEISSDVLIPRQETEILVEHILKEVPEDPFTVWDLCTGSGCIGISLKKKRAHWSLSLSDNSCKALDVAKKNSVLNSVEVEFLQGDLLDPFRGRKAHIIVCNPPYIAEREYDKLEDEVRCFEPKSALIAGVSGYEFYERLALELPFYLHPGGKVFFEIGAGMGPGVQKIFQKPIWKRASFATDWSGLDRFFFLEIE